MSEPRAVAEKRLRMRSMRRGIKEMDLILMDFADRHLAGLSEDDLARYDQLLSENDHDILAWILGKMDVPARYDGLIGRIAAGAAGVAKPRAT